ncbi:MAG: hypothetical protein CBARDCOR_3429 [uncultured Caballeronia sp.]|nr:MAG: hypothetical protein CBARDCOR_3429 [uncultured Caballeronia sp.]
MSTPAAARTSKYLADLIENGGKPLRAGFLGLFRDDPKHWVPQTGFWIFTLLLILAHRGRR